MDKQIVSLEEAYLLGAEDGEFYSHYFFPRTFRQESPLIHRQVWEGLSNPDSRFVNMKMFRGSAKTTLLRTFASRQVAYQLSHTALVIGKSESHAVRTIQWVQKAVEFNKLWSQAFGLRPGSKWSGSEIEILGPQGYSCRLIALGITGSVRGVNVDDFRPDLIIVDDPLDEDNTATPEQRAKIEELFFGAVQNSLAPRSEAPLAKMALLNTPLNESDLGELCTKDPSWTSFVFSCFDENGESAWPSRWPTEELKADKASYMARNQAHIWYREMECKIIAPALSSFRAAWLKHWTVLPENAYTIVSIDPTPPPKEGTNMNSRRVQQLDDAVIMATIFYGGNVYVAEYYIAKSPNPLEFISKIFEFVRRYQPRKVAVETVLFQRVLAFYLRQQMLKENLFFTITEVEDKRKKKTRIEQAITDRASNGRLYVHPSQTELIAQFSAYPNTNHDDLLDALAIAITSVNPAFEGEVVEGDFTVEETKPLVGWRNCP